VIPEWVEFQRHVEPDPRRRYQGASNSLKMDLRSIRRAPFETVITTDAADLRYFFDRMYLPYIQSRFGTETIRKSYQRLRRDFRAGFLMLLHHEGEAVAGALVRLSGRTVRLTTLGVLDGSMQVLRSHVSGALDYYLHAWAADHGMQTINVGHTRPLPQDGVFFNKRKWQMAIMPDRDGVTGLALRWRGPDPPFLEVLDQRPLVYEGKAGLGVLCVWRSEPRLDTLRGAHLVRQHWTNGLSSFIGVCPQGFDDRVERDLNKTFGGAVRLCSDLRSAMSIYQRAG